MKITLGNKGLDNTWQVPFPEETPCAYCDGEARIAFTAYEPGYDGEKHGPNVCSLHPNKGGDGGDFWLHDVAAYAIYHCKKCLKVTAEYNQG